MQNRNKKAIRATQFQPFDALKGFKEEIQKRNKVIVPKRELSEDYLQDMSNILTCLEVGMMVKVIYELNDEYIKVEGILTKKNLDERYIDVVKTRIKIDSIIKINCEEIELKNL